LDNWAGNRKVLSGTPYNSHTVNTALKRTLLNASRMLAKRSYRGSENISLYAIQITGKRRERTEAHHNQWNRPNNLEPIIALMKNDFLIPATFLDDSLTAPYTRFCAASA
jgi:IS5 family transposase